MTDKTIAFSLLDLAPIPEGSSAREAFSHSLDLARLAEKRGYHRYWLAEHHNMTGIASAATSVLIGYLAANTTTLHLGSGGVMLPNHSPLVIAEQFGTLNTLYPGRIDLGLGRAPGSDQRTMMALRRHMSGDIDNFPRDVAELVDWFDARDPNPHVRPVPGYGEKIPVWLLGSSLYSAQLAAQLGLPFATSTTVSYYNMDLLKEAGWDKVPETFDDVIRLYQDMQTKGLTQKVLQTVPNTPTLANWLGQLGSYVVNEKNGSEGTATELACIDNGALAAFLTQWKAMYDAGALINESGSADMFIAGDLVMMTNSSSNVAPVLEKVNGAFEVGVGKYLRVSADASDGATVAGSCLSMFDSDDDLRKEASWVFMQYLASAAVQADFAANTGYIPSNTAAMDEDIYKTVTAEYPQYLVAYDQLISTPADMRSVTVGPSKDFYYAIMQGVSDMLENDQTVEETVEIMSDEMQNLLTEYARNNAVA